MDEQKKPNQMVQTLIMVVLVSITAWAAMTFTQNRNQAEYEKQAPATDAKEKSEKPQAPAASAPAAPGVAATVPDASLQAPAPAQDTPQYVIDESIGVYHDVDAYSATFQLLQPRNAKETGKPDVLKNLTETFHLAWKKNSENSPDKDSFRIEGVSGFNRCTVAGFSPDAQMFSVFHPKAKPMTVPAGDMRMRDLYETGIHVIAHNTRQLMLDPDTEVSLDKVTMRLTGRDQAREYFKITITKKDGAREVATINAQTFALEMHEVYHYNKKGKTDSQRYWLGRSIVWSEFKPGKPHGDDWYIRKPDFKKLQCSR